MSTTTTREEAWHQAFRHEALFYSGDQELLAGTAPFVRDGVAAGEPVLVALPQPRLDVLRGELGADAEAVSFVDMVELGANPARIIPAWQDFLARHGDGRRPVRGIGEPIWAGRGDAELAEAQVHETLLNVAFARSGTWRLLCPYDVDALPPAVLQEAERSHPWVTRNAVTAESRACRGLDEMARPSASPLPDPPPEAAALTFGEDDVRAVRRFMLQKAARAGLDDRRTNELLLAVHEIVTNSVRHAGGWGFLRSWQDDENLICEVLDEGHIRQPLLGRQRPPTDATGGRGVWLANQLCDLVQIRTSAGGNVVRLHMRRA